MALARKVFAAGVLIVSATGIGMIQKFEDTVPVAYLDTVKVSTICTGHTKGVTLGMRATLEQCEQYLKEDLTEVGKAVGKCVRVPVTQEQYDALTSLTFNIGGGAFCRSTLVKKLNTGDCVGAGREFMKWDRAGKNVSRGLQNRRKAEAALFIRGCE